MGKQEEGDSCLSLPLCAINRGRNDRRKGQDEKGRADCHVPLGLAMTRGIPARYGALKIILNYSYGENFET